MGQKWKLTERGRERHRYGNRFGRAGKSHMRDEGKSRQWDETRKAVHYTWLQIWSACIHYWCSLLSWRAPTIQFKVILDSVFDWHSEQMPIQASSSQWLQLSWGFLINKAWQMATTYLIHLLTYQHWQSPFSLNNSSHLHAIKFSLSITTGSIYTLSNPTPYLLFQ